MKNKDGKGREYLNTALRAGEDKLLHNSSRGEQALCWVTVLLALMSLVMSAVTAIAGGDAMTIARAFTEKPVLFVLIVLLTVYDRVFLLRGRSLTVIVFCLLSIVRDVFGVMGADGFAVVLAVLSLLAGTAFYGTIFVDQLSPNDHRLKYRIIYGGALVRLLVILISIIAQGSGLAEAGTAEVLAVMAHGFTEIFVLALMVCHFDSGFGYLKFILNEITAPAEAEYVPFDDEPEAAYVPLDEPAVESVKNVDSIENIENTESVEPDEAPNPAEPDEDVLDDFGYVPYDDDSPDAAVDSSVRPVVMSAEDVGEPEAAYPAVSDGDEPMTVVEEDGVLVDDSVIEYERAQRRREAAEAAEAAVAKAAEAASAAVTDTAEDVDTDTDAAPSSQPESRAQQLWAQLTPIEQRYVSFGLAHHKPEDTLQVEGLSGDLFDVWLDDDTICFQNDLDQASNGRGVRTAAIPFDAVQNIGLRDLDGEQCIVLTYIRDGETVEIGFTRASFGNFRRVVLG